MEQAAIFGRQLGESVRGLDLSVRLGLGLFKNTASGGVVVSCSGWRSSSARFRRKTERVAVA